LVWIVPVVGAAVAVAGLTVVFRRWRLDEVVEASPEDEAVVAQARGERR